MGKAIIRSSENYLKVEELKMKVLVETSARHLHLSQEHLEILFGAGHELTVKKNVKPARTVCL